MPVWGEGEGEGEVVEQQIGALGNPCSPFSSSSSLLCIRRGFDKKSHSRQRRTPWSSPGRGTWPAAAGPPSLTLSWCPGVAQDKEPGQLQQDLHLLPYPGVPGVAQDKEPGQLQQDLHLLPYPGVPGVAQDKEPDQLLQDLPPYHLVAVHIPK